MLPLRFHSNLNIDFIIKLLIAVVLTCIVAPVRISLKSEMPITLQSFIILFFAIAFGWRVGGLSALLYIAAGVAGLPVFSNYSHGYGALIGLYGGFFYGFVFAAVTCGFLAEQKLFKRQLAAVMNWMLGHIIILAFGFFIIIQRDDDWQQKLNLLWPGALIKSVTGALIIQLLLRFLNTKENRNDVFVDAP